MAHRFYLIFLVGSVPLGMRILLILHRLLKLCIVTTIAEVVNLKKTFSKIIWWRYSYFKKEVVVLFLVFVVEKNVVISDTEPGRGVLETKYVDQNLFEGFDVMSSSRLKTSNQSKTLNSRCRCLHTTDFS